MTDLQSILDAIDEVAVHECGHCTAPLAVDGPSADFCGQVCQQAWTERRNEIVELVNYREPCDVPQHAYNLVEARILEVTPPTAPWLSAELWRGVIRMEDTA